MLILKTVFNNAAQIKSVLRDLHTQKCSSKAQIVAISGIEGAGKRVLTEKIAEALRLEGIAVTIVHTEDWKTSESTRFNVMNSPEEYYLHAYRFSEMIEKLILPLKLFGHVKTSVTLDNVMQPTTVTYDVEKTDIVLIEGVYLLQEAYLDLYDYTCWVQSDYDAAYLRLSKQTHLDPSAKSLLHLFEGLIKPAGQYHIYSDDPQGNTDSIYIEQENEKNDPNTT
ncbi:uridine kinase family protein [Psychromonas sp. CD1]|uniref:uridine kinase family protein n=1 Tax=Psychromonas sp. CD1 TaxID=1979839 RepID=UPI002150BB7F|nr:uridine kinase [Psychromonas sp. CD1]